jgi:uncharacterized membrane protein
MSNKKLLGIGLVIVSVGLAYWGYQLSSSVESQLSNAFSGSPTNKVMMVYSGAAVSLLLGLFLIKKG